MGGEWATQLSVITSRVIILPHEPFATSGRVFRVTVHDSRNQDPREVGLQVCSNPQSQKDIIFPFFPEAKQLRSKSRQEIQSQVKRDTVHSMPQHLISSLIPFFCCCGSSPITCAHKDTSEDIRRVRIKWSAGHTSRSVR